MFEKKNFGKEIEKAKTAALALDAEQQMELDKLEDEYKKKLEDLKEAHDDHMADELTQKDNKRDRESISLGLSETEALILKEKKEGMKEINELERMKIYAIKKLDEEMDFKVKETQANLMALNDEQLQTSTRLTILQNHSLTTELDYQSK